MQMIPRTFLLRAFTETGSPEANAEAAYLILEHFPQGVPLSHEGLATLGVPGLATSLLVVCLPAPIREAYYAACETARKSVRVAEHAAAHDRPAVESALATLRAAVDEALLVGLRETLEGRTWPSCPPLTLDHLMAAPDVHTELRARFMRFFPQGLEMTPEAWEAARFAGFEVEDIARLLLPADERARYHAEAVRARGEVERRLLERLLSATMPRVKALEAKVSDGATRRAPKPG